MSAKFKPVLATKSRTKPPSPEIRTSTRLAAKTKGAPSSQKSENKGTKSSYRPNFK